MQQPTQHKPRIRCHHHESRVSGCANIGVAGVHVSLPWYVIEQLATSGNDYLKHTSLAAKVRAAISL